MKQITESSPNITVHYKMKYTSKIKFKGKKKSSSKLEQPSSLKEQDTASIAKKAGNYLQANAYDERTFCSPTQSLNSKSEKASKSGLIYSTETAIGFNDIDLHQGSEPFADDIKTVASAPYMNKTIILYQMWLLSHLFTLASFLCYSRNVTLNKNPESNLNSKFYVVCLISSMSTYCFVLFRIYKIKLQYLLEPKSHANNYSTMDAIFSLGSLFQSENFHLVINSCLFLVNFKMQSMWKLLSFFIFSSLNLANYVCYELHSSLSPKVKEDPISVVEQVTETFKPFLNLVADPLLCLVTFIDMCQFGIIYVVDIKKAQSPRQKLLGQFTLLGYTGNYILRLEYVEKSRYALNYIVKWTDSLVGEKLLTMLNKRFDNHKNIINETNNWCWHKKNAVFGAFCRIVMLLNKLWFDWARHGINILLPLKHVDDSILKNQISIPANDVYLSCKSFNSI